MEAQCLGASATPPPKRRSLGRGISSMRWRDNSIRTRLMLLSVAVILPLLGFIGYTLQDIRARDHREALERTLSATRIVAARADEHIAHIESLLVAIRAIVEPNLAAVDDNDRRLRTLQQGFPPHVGNIAVIDVQGRVINSSLLDRIERRKYNFADRAHFQRVVATPGLSFSDPLISRMIGEWCVIAYLPIHDKAGKVLALASVSTRLKAFEQILAPDGMPPGTVATLLNADHKVVARTLDMDHWVGRDVTFALRRAHISGIEPYNGIWNGFDGVERYAGFVPTRRLGWLAYVGLTTPVAIAEASARQRALIVWAIVTLLFAGIIAALLARSLARPISRLAEAVNRFGAGELDVRCTSSAGPREIRALAREFNTLADLRQREDSALRDNLERLRLATRAANIGLWDWDVRTNAIRYSDEWKTQLGYAPNELADELTTWERLCHPEDRLRIEQLLREYFAAPWADYESEFRMRHKDGHYVHIFTRAAVIVDATGAPIRMLGCHIDLTRRKADEEKIAAQLDELRRWQEVTLGREERVRQLKAEINLLLLRAGRAPRYPSALQPPQAEDQAA